MKKKLAEADGAKNVAIWAKDEAVRAKEEAEFARTEAECFKEKAVFSWSSRASGIWW